MVLRVFWRSIAAIAVWCALMTQSYAAPGPPECSLKADMVSPPSPQPPADVCNGPSVPPPPLDYFNALAWQTFKLLVWPASQTMRGEPDTGASITDMNGLRTFETFKANWEVFQDKIVKPDEWNTYPATATPCAGQPTIDHNVIVLGSFNEFGVIQEPSFQGVANVLVARNSTFVRYLAGMNKAEFEVIRDHGLYDPKVVATLPAKLDPNSPALAPYGAMTIKSAWVEIPQDNTQQQIDLSRFFWRWAWVQSRPNVSNSDYALPECHLAKVALVGLHFVHKTSSRPQWVWATFEHVDNVPGDCGTPANGSYTFHPGGLTVGVGNTPPTEWQFPNPTPTPLNVERKQIINASTCKTNAAWQKELRKVGSVWQYYQLVMTQWPATASSPSLDADHATPTPPCVIGPANTATANVTMETFFQGPTQCHNATQPTCMTCHNAARNADFVFAIELIYPHKSITQTPLVRLQALSTLQRIVEQARRTEQAR